MHAMMHQAGAQSATKPSAPRKPALLGLGNVLLDWIVTVTDEEFGALGLNLPRGQVRRISPVEQEALLHRITATGNNAENSVRPQGRLSRAPGGSCANALRTFAWHGGNAKLLGLAGDDAAADFLTQAYQSAGLDTSGIKRHPGHTTDACLAFVTPDGERTMLPAFDAGTLGGYNLFNINDLDNYNALHLEGYNLRFPQMLAGLLDLAAKRNLRLSWDLGDVSLVRTYHSALQTIFATHSFDCIFANLFEAQEFTGYHTAIDTAKALADHCSCAIVTCGADGAWLGSKNGASTHIPAVKPTALVDTIGAGDSFQGTFLAKYHEGATPVVAAKAAAAFAAKVIALPGATLPAKPR